MNVSGVKAAEMPEVWPHVTEYFADFANRAGGELTAGQLLHDVLAGTRQCWIAYEGAEIRACALTEVLGNPRKTLVLGFCGGKGREDWRDAVVAEIEAWARHMGSERVRIVCRPGWSREIKALDYRETHRVLEKELQE